MSAVGERCVPLPCPCCKGEPAVKNFITEAVVSCAVCHLAIIRRHRDCSDDTPAVAEAVAAWNRRAPQSGLEVAARDTTPSSRWAAQGQPDPHGSRFNCARSQLPMGNLTDDELANEVFLYDHRSGLGSIGYLQAAKDRIRWLSRALQTAPVLPDGVGDDKAPISGTGWAPVNDGEHMIARDCVGATESQATSTFIKGWPGGWPQASAAGWRMSRVAITVGRQDKDSPDGAPSGRKVWLWREGDQFVVYEHEHPCVPGGGDPLTLGEPVATGMLMPSSAARQDRDRGDG